MQRPKLFLVDDEEDLLELSGFILEQNFDIIGQATNGKEAIELITNLEEKPDAILLDIILPEMNGFDVCEWVKRTYPNIKVILFTVKDSDKDIERGKKAGADAHIIKPTERDEIIKTIHKVLQIIP